MSIQESIEKFLKELATTGRSPLTLGHYRGHLRAFAHWLESAGDGTTDEEAESLDLDRTEVQVAIRFPKSSSPAFGEALEIAKTFPTYRFSAERKMHELTVPLALDEGDLWERVSRLADLVGHWKHSRVVVEGAAVENFFEFRDALSQIKQCHAERRRSGLGDLYCSGRDTPSAEASAFGCRLLGGVARDGEDLFNGGAPWFHFGELAEDQAAFRVDKAEISRMLKTRNARELCTACPHFSWERVEAEIAELPDSLALGDASRFQIRYSTIDPSKPLGIETKGTAGRSLLERGAADSPERQVPSVHYSDVAAQDAAVAALRCVIELPLTHGDYFSALGVEPHGGIILWGPPGNGKTLIAKAAATESAAHLEIINGPEVLSKWVGESEANLRAVFERARSLAPSIVLIDEIDALAPTRESVLRQHEISLISQLLVLLDGLEGRGRVVVIATTNRIEAVDPALCRTGRFDYHLRVGPPDAVGRRAILERHLEKLKTAAALDLRDIARRTEGFSGAELAALCREAGLGAIERALGAGIAPEDLVIEAGDLECALQALREKRISKRRCGSFNGGSLSKTANLHGQSSKKRRRRP